ncbi:MAG: lipoprotein [Lysobacter sp.]|nr:lipoprotein [Lysobacter sp.]
MNRRPAYVLAAMALCLALSACGNKGPLVLPDKPDDAPSAATDGTTGRPGPAGDANARHR